jgi:hypothetical protein
LLIFCVLAFSLTPELAHLLLQAVDFHLDFWQLSCIASLYVSQGPFQRTFLREKASKKFMMKGWDVAQVVECLAGPKPWVTPKNIHDENKSIDDVRKVNFFFSGTGVWTQASHLLGRSSTLEPLYQPFFGWVFFEVGSHKLLLQAGFEPATGLKNKILFGTWSILFR